MVFESSFSTMKSVLQSMTRRSLHTALPPICWIIVCYITREKVACLICLLLLLILWWPVVIFLVQLSSFLGLLSWCWSSAFHCLLMSLPLPGGIWGEGSKKHTVMSLIIWTTQLFEPSNYLNHPIIWTIQLLEPSNYLNTPLFQKNN